MNTDIQTIFDAIPKLAAATSTVREEARQAIEGAVERIGDTHIDPESLDAALVVSTLLQLRDVCEFDTLFELASGLIDFVPDPKVRLLRTQAAIELKEYAVASFEIYGLLDQYSILPEGISKADQMTAARTHSEAKGMFGRLNKQQYVDTASLGWSRRSRIAREAHLLAAVESYAAPFQRYFDTRDRDRRWFEPAYYPGVNLVALLSRAERDGVSYARIARRLAPALQVGAAEIARLLLEQLVPYASVQVSSAALNEHRADVWSVGTVGELLLAMDPARAATQGWGTPEQWLARYADMAKLTQFQLAGTIRQLEEVWLIRPTDPPYRSGALTRLKAVTAVTGGEVTIAPAQRDSVVGSEGNYEMNRPGFVGGSNS